MFPKRTTWLLTIKHDCKAVELGCLKTDEWIDGVLSLTSASPLAAPLSLKPSCSCWLGIKDRLSGRKQTHGNVSVKLRFPSVLIPRYWSIDYHITVLNSLLKYGLLINKQDNRRSCVISGSFRLPAELLRCFVGAYCSGHVTRGAFATIRHSMNRWLWEHGKQKGALHGHMVAKASARREGDASTETCRCMEEKGIQRTEEPCFAGNCMREYFHDWADGHVRAVAASAETETPSCHDVHVKLKKLLFLFTCLFRHVFMYFLLIGWML